MNDLLSGIGGNFGLYFGGSIITFVGKWSRKKVIFFLSGKAPPPPPLSGHATKNNFFAASLMKKKNIYIMIKDFLPSFEC